jgi:hypothetical protein
VNSAAASNRYGVMAAMATVGGCIENNGGNMVSGNENENIDNNGEKRR